MLRNIFVTTLKLYAKLTFYRDLSFPDQVALVTHQDQREPFVLGVPPQLLQVLESFLRRFERSGIL